MNNILKKIKILEEKYIKNIKDPKISEKEKESFANICNALLKKIYRKCKMIEK